MFRFQSPLIVSVLVMGVGTGLNLAAFAQTSPAETSQARQNRTLSLDEAIEIAEQNNKELKIARLEASNAAEALKAAKTANLPTLSASGRLFRADSSTFSASPGGVVQTAEQAATAAQTAFNAASQRAAARAEFSEQLAQLQIQLQNTDLFQDDTFDQQLAELSNSANAGAFLPDPAGEVPFPRFQGFSPSNSLLFFDSIANTLEGDVTLFYNILTGGARSAAIRAASNQLKLSDLQVLLLTRDLNLEVASLYYDLQEVRGLMRVALSAVMSAEQTLQNTILTEQAGISTKFEALQAEVQLADANQNLSLARSLQLTAQSQLAELLSLPENTNIVPTEAVEPIGDWITSLPQSIVSAQNNRIALQQLLLSREIQEDQRIIVRAVKRPNLSSFAQLSASASDVEPGSALDPNIDNFQGTLGYSVGLQVTLNAFNGGETKAELQEIDEIIKILDTQYDELKNTIRLEVESGFFSLSQNRENIETSRGAVDLARESLELARLRLQAGIGTQLDIIRAEADLTQAEGNLISAVLDYNRAVTSIARATAFQLPLENYTGSSFQSQN